MLDFLGPPLLIHCFISLFYQNTKIHQTNKTNQSFISIKPFFAQLGQFGNSCNVSEQNKQSSTDEFLRKIATEMMSFFMFRQLIELVRMVNTITPNLPPFSTRRSWPTYWEQRIYTKYSGQSTNIYLNSSEFEQPQISFNIKHIFHNLSSNQWSRGNCAWNEENARHRHWALGNQGRPCKWNQVPWKFPKTFTFPSSCLKCFESNFRRYQYIWIAI